MATPTRTGRGTTAAERAALLARTRVRSPEPERQVRGGGAPAPSPAAVPPASGLTSSQAEASIPRSLQKFNETVGVVLAEAYATFPSGAVIRPGFVLGKLRRADSLGEVRHVSNTLRWLDQEGYIRLEPHQDHAFRVVLSGKGLAVLTTTPSSLHAAKQSLGEAMVAEVKRGGREALGVLAREAILAGARALGGLAWEGARHLLR